jgi:hypothetical protein
MIVEIDNLVLVEKINGAIWVVVTQASDANGMFFAVDQDGKEHQCHVDEIDQTVS